MTRLALRLIVATPVAGLLLALLATTATAGRPTTHWVDKDGSAGPNGCGGTHAASTSIQPAIDASGPGDRVLVCPGRYVEQIYIHGAHAGLTLKSVERYGAVIFAPQTLAVFNEAPALVMVDHVNGVTMRGFQVTARTAAPCDDAAGGVVAIRSRGTNIRSNLINAQGAAVNGDCALLEGLVVVSSDQGGSSPTSAFVGYNTLRDFALLGIGVGSDANLDVDITQNSVHVPSLASPPSPSKHESFVAHGTSPAGSPIPFGAGILVIGDGTNADVIRNRTIGPPPPVVAPQGVLIPSYGVYVSGPVGKVNVIHNFARQVFVGIELIGTAGVKVRENLTRQTLGGLVVDQSSMNHVRDNDFRGFEVGIFSQTQSSANVYRNNVASSCDDESSGSGTANTDNTWIGNHAGSDTPDGICPPIP